MTYYDAMAFCRSFGAKLVELNTVAEYNYITSTGKQHVSMTSHDLFHGQPGAFLRGMVPLGGIDIPRTWQKELSFLHFLFVP